MGFLVFASADRNRTESEQIVTKKSDEIEPIVNDFLGDVDIKYKTQLWFETYS